MKPGIQTFLSEAGEAACYALDIIQIASELTGRNISPLEMLELGIHLGVIYYNQADQDDNDNFFVKAPARFLTIITGVAWDVEHVGADYQPAPGEHVVERWERKTPSGSFNHFRLPHWDSLADSKTVRFGAIASKRVFRRKR